ncbi:sensor domain-containing phosphodiesterase [Duganella sp. P38]|uniref:sensor domain-containing phosphodiesterase n=1 Tax=Duganella sp. P38 TaxID=3423949 RepID=UPI003D7A534D
MDTPDDPAFDALTSLAAKIFGVPIALVSLVDEGRQWFKSRIGVKPRQTPRSQAFCAYALHNRDPLVVLDTLQDERFSSNALVTAEPYMRFYAGAPLITNNGMCLGTLCIIDVAPRTSFSAAHLDQLQHLAAIIMMRIETLRSIGYVDQLTMLPNRVRFLEDLGLWMKELAVPDAPPRHLSAVALDVCGAAYFQEMAAALGGDYADGYLQTAQANIVVALAPAPVYRIDMTVFGCVIEAEDDGALAAELEILQTMFSNPIEYQGIPHAPPVVTGAARLHAGGAATEVARTLSSTLAQARGQQAGSGIYQQVLDAEQQRAFRILAAIPEALASAGQLALHYQPRVCLRTGRCVGVEALLRWSHPVLGAVSPAEFIPLAEKTALMRQMTAWVLRTALSQAEAWQRSGLGICVALNVSALDLDYGDFAGHLGQHLKARALDPSLVEVEFTESALCRTPERLKAQLTELRALGVQVAIDDFGAGYSNLSYLKQIPATALKIDQSFVRALPDNEHDETLVRSMITLGHDFGHRVVAEGVESEEVYRLLASWGCDEGQGYWIARPMLAPEFAAWLKRRTALAV